MRAALVVNPVTADFQANLDAVLRMAQEAGATGAKLVLFPEAAITGLVNDDDPEHDLPLGQIIPGPYTERLARVAAHGHLWLAIGLLERAEDRLYDSAVLLSPTGEVALRHRRVHPGWHVRHAPPQVYCHGKGFRKVTTPLGSFAFSVCGEYFDDTLATLLQSLNADWLLAPMARCFADGSGDQERWDNEELPSYRDRVRRVGTTTLLTNYLAARDLDGGSFGGAWVISGDGSVLGALPLGQVGMLVIDLIERPRRTDDSIPPFRGFKGGCEGRCHQPQSSAQTGKRRSLSRRWANTPIGPMGTDNGPSRYRLRPFLP